MAVEREHSLWKDRKRTFLGLPWSFTVYELTDDRLFVNTGFFSINEEEIRLYRVLDIDLKMSFGQRVFQFGCGSIILRTSDKSSPSLEIKNIKDPRRVKELLSKQVEYQRDQKRIVGREMMGGPLDGDFDADEN